MGALLSTCMGGLDDKKLTLAIDKAFEFFDKDKSGAIEKDEFTEAVRKALSLAGPIGKKVTDEHIATAFSKVAGADNKIDKNEFGHHVRMLVEKVGGPKTAADHPATGAAVAGAAPVTAAAAADTAA